MEDISVREVNRFLTGTPLEEIDFSVVKEEDIPGSVLLFEFWVEWCRESHDKSVSKYSKQKGGKNG